MTSKKISKVTIRHAEQALSLLFPGVAFVVAPNHSNEIWIKNPYTGDSMAFSCGIGKAGISARLRKAVGGAPVTITGNDSPDMACIPQVDAFEVSATVYKSDERSQAFKAWYGSDEATKQDNPYPGVR